MQTEDKTKTFFFSSSFSLKFWRRSILTAPFLQSWTIFSDSHEKREEEKLNKSDILLWRTKCSKKSSKQDWKYFSV